MGTIVSCNQRGTPSIETCDGYLIESFVHCWKCSLNSNIKQFQIGEKSNDYRQEANESFENKTSVFVPDAIKRYQSPNLWREHVESKVIGEQSSCNDQSHQQLYTESLECPLCTGKKSSKLRRNGSKTFWNKKSLNNKDSDSPAANTDNNQSKSVSSVLTARSSSTPRSSTCKQITIAEINKTVRKCFDEINDQQISDQYQSDSNSFKTSVEVLERASMSTANSFKAPLVTIDPPKSINKDETNVEKLKDEIEKDKADEIHYSSENETLSDRKREEKSIEKDIRLSQDTEKEEVESGQKLLTLLKSADEQSSTSIDNWYAVAKDDKNTGSNGNDNNSLSDGNSNSCDSDIYDNATTEQNHLSNVATKSMGNEFVLNSLDNISLSSLSTVESDNDIGNGTNALIPSRLASNMSSYQTQLMVSQLETSAFTGSIGTMRCSLCRLYQLGSETFWLSLDDDILTILKLYQSLSECLREKERQLWNNNVELEYKERIARLRMRKRTRISIEKQSENKVVVILKDGHTVYCIEGE